MQTQVQQPQEKETWIKILSKGVITIPKDVREQLGLEEGDVARAKVVGNSLVIQSRKVSEEANMRIFSKEQMNEWVKEDELPEPLGSEVEKRWADLP